MMFQFLAITVVGNAAILGQPDTFDKILWISSEKCNFPLLFFNINILIFFPTWVKLTQVTAFPTAINVLVNLAI